jgi:hypothetical protein
VRRVPFAGLANGQHGKFIEVCTPPDVGDADFLECRIGPLVLACRAGRLNVLGANAAWPPKTQGAQYSANR